MTTITPEQEDRLAAWLDGALPAGEAAAFAAEIAANPSLRALEQEWRANDALIAGAFAHVAETPIDPALIRRMGLLDTAAPALPDAAPALPDAAPALPDAANDNRASPWHRHARWGGALAAACVAAAVFVMRPGTGPDPLSLALDHTASMASASLPDGRKIQPMLTVRAADGRWCREFRAGDSIALACRESNGRWKTESLGQVPAAEPVDADGIALAAGPDGAALDSAYRRLRASDPVDAQAEARLIAGGWR